MSSPNNPTHIFRMTHKNNISIFVNDGAIYALSCKSQPQWAISYDNITNRRKSQQNTNDKIAFYFSPLTSMAYAISQGGVPLRCPKNQKQEDNAKLLDVVFIVLDIQKAITEYEYQFTNQAFNKETQIADIYNSWDNDKDKIHWNLFNEHPIKGKILEIGYNGAGRYFNSISNEDKWLQRGDIRMAEFWIKDRLDLNDICCFIVKNTNVENFIKEQMQGTQYEKIPVYCKSDVYL